VLPPFGLALVEDFIDGETGRYVEEMDRIRLKKNGDVVIVHFPEIPTAEMVHELFDTMEPLLQERPHAIVLDATAVRSVPISVREAAGRRLKVMEPLFRRSLRGQATVITSPLVRGALATIHFFARPKFPAESFADLESAISWARAQLLAGGSGEYRSAEP
jgi:hypothetical protein